MEDLTLRDYIKVIFRQKWIIILCVITVTLIVAVGLKFQTKKYAASVKLLISAQKQSESPFYHDIVGYQGDLAMTESEIVTSTPVLERALKAILPYRPLSNFLEYEKRYASPIKQKWIDHQVKKIYAHLNMLELTDDQKQSYFYRLALESLRKNVKVDPIHDTNVFTITVTDFDPVQAAIMANIISRSYIIFDLEQQLADMQQKYGEKNLAISQLRDNINTMTQNLTGQPLDDVEAIGPASVKIIEQAYPPTEPLGKNKSIVLILAFIMSVLLGLILAFIFDYMDQTFRSPDDIERALGIPFLGSVPKGKKVAYFRNVAEQIYLLMKDKELKSLVFIASRRGEGISTVSRNVGKYISSSLGHRVLIIDANPRHKLPKLKKGLSRPLGLYDILEEKADLSQCIQKIDEKLHFLPAGQTTLSSYILLGSQHMTEILRQAKAKYEMVLIDTDSVNTSKDALELSNSTDAIVLIVAEGGARLHAVKSVLEIFKKRKAIILGAILNKRKFPLPRFLYERV